MVLSSTCKSAPGEARSEAEYATQQGEVASTMLAQTRVLPPLSAAMGPLMERIKLRATSVPVTTMLGSPGETGLPSRVRLIPGTNVESEIWMVAVSPAMESCPAIHSPLISSWPGVAVWPGGNGAPGTQLT